METSYQGGVAGDEADNFQRLSQTIASNVKKISQNVSSMSKMVNQLQTPQDSQELRNQLRQIQNYTQKLAKDTSTILMELMKMRVNQSAQKLQRERLSDEYISTLNTFLAVPIATRARARSGARSSSSHTYRNV
ncbi:Syntaxin-12 [Papilio machaon]|uniref:Syntaxin-12 n=1 Tax=Papilio machaon TaxID=76193 RepID=A0A0N1PJT1_PAPMA|nr:Syntaxin-12 [Papilio machaon]